MSLTTHKQNVTKIDNFQSKEGYDIIVYHHRVRKFTPKEKITEDTYGAEAFPYQKFEKVGNQWYECEVGVTDKTEWDKV